jgi:hypothetical protein
MVLPERSEVIDPCCCCPKSLKSLYDGPVDGMPGGGGETVQAEWQTRTGEKIPGDTRVLIIEAKMQYKGDGPLRNCLLEVWEQINVDSASKYLLMLKGFPCPLGEWVEMSSHPHYVASLQKNEGEGGWGTLTPWNKGVGDMKSCPETKEKTVTMIDIPTILNVTWSLLGQEWRLKGGKGCECDDATLYLRGGFAHAGLGGFYSPEEVENSKIESIPEGPPGWTCKAPWFH